MCIGVSPKGKACEFGSHITGSNPVTLDKMPMIKRMKIIKCPVCKNDEFDFIERTRQGTIYQVYTCRKCRYVMRREKKANVNNTLHIAVFKSARTNSDHVHDSSDS